MSIKAPDCMPIFTGVDSKFLCCEWPKLYKRTKTGAIQEWQISVKGLKTGNQDDPHTIVTQFGQVGGAIQTTEDEIREGKNVGKKNETSPYEQTINEAQARWEKQLKKGYVKSIAAAQAGETDAVIEGGIAPMLAHKFSEHETKIKYPCYLQPKLDGTRCIAIIDPDGKTTLWTRSRKPITSVPHVVAALSKLSNWKHRIILDGELYNHDYKDKFEELISLIRPVKPKEGHEAVQYHVYDIVTDEPFCEREVRLRHMISQLSDAASIKLVSTLLMMDNRELLGFYDFFLDQGYEGAIVRNSDGMYQNSRSYDLQKLKLFEEAEFEVIGIDEGRGKLSGHAGALVCKTEQGTVFRAKMDGQISRLRDVFQKPDLVIGKLATVQFQKRTKTNNVPRFPVVKTIRDYE